MTLVEIVEVISESTKLKKKDIAHTLRLFLEEVGDALERGETVKLREFGTFTSKTLKPGKLFGGKREVGERTTVRFKPSRRSKWRSTPSSTKKSR